MVKPVLLICSCRKYEKYLHAAIKRMARPEWEIIGILGGGTGPATFDDISRVLTLPSDDTYERLPSKMHAAFSWVWANRPGLPGIFKTDEDVLFDIPVLANTVVANVALPYWGITSSLCKAGEVPLTRIENRFVDKTLRPVHQSAVYSFGWGYWLSAEVLPIICAAGDEYEKSPLEDVCTGYVLNKVGVGPKKYLVPYSEVPRDKKLLK
jgi:Galactosyltransferase